MKIGSSKAFVIYIITLFITYIVATIRSTAPFLGFATQLTVGFSAYLSKRYFDKKIITGVKNERTPE